MSHEPVYKIFVKKTQETLTFSLTFMDQKLYPIFYVNIFQRYRPSLVFEMCFYIKP